MSRAERHSTIKNELTKYEKICKVDANTRWLICPVCGKKLIKLLPTTAVKDFPLYCRYCKQEAIVNIPLKPES